MTEIKKFLGLNKTGDTELKLGEASKCENFRITDGYAIKKMEGYKKLFVSLGTGEIQGQWDGYIGGTYFYIFNYAGTLYKVTDEGNVDIGDVADKPTTFFYFGTKLYILDGTTYKSFDGTTLAAVVGYAPLIAINAPPEGGGTLFEQVNLLTGQKRMNFDANGSAVDFVLPEASVDSIDTVKVNGEVVTTGITKDLTTAKVTFTVAPAAGVGNVEITWTEANTTNRAFIDKCTQMFIFGGASDTRVFMYGNPDTKHREYFSGIATTPTAEYFPANNYNDIGSSQYAITGMERQYDRRIILKGKETFYGTIGSFYDANNILITTFPVFPLNSERGNIAVGQTRVIKNNPVSICEDGVYEWVSTNVRDERNSKKISDEVWADLEGLDLSTAVTFDWQEKNELWICIPSESKCWVYKYNLPHYNSKGKLVDGVWFVRTNIKANNFRVIDGELYFGSTGTIYKFEEDLRIDEGDAIIDAVYETGFYGFRAEWLRKNIRKNLGIC